MKVTIPETVLFWVHSNGLYWLAFVPGHWHSTNESTFLAAETFNPSGNQSVFPHPGSVSPTGEQFAGGGGVKEVLEVISINFTSW